MARPRCVAMVGTWVVTCSLLGCFGPTQGPTLTEVSGTVTVDGKPLEEGVIAFDTADGVYGAYGGEVREGKYRLKSAAGMKLVSIMGFRSSNQLGPDGLPGKEQFLPAKFNSHSELKVDILAGQENVHSFDLKTRP